MRVLSLGLVFTLLAAVGCDANSCRDVDLDGFGERCAMGPDCDDANADRNVDCVSVLPPDCDATPTATGCPCIEGQLANCYRGPIGTRGQGICRAGRSQCVSGHYGACVGEVLPLAFEICDGIDNDCDARADESVTSPCGRCDAACTGGVWGDGGAPFTASKPLALNPRGDLTLASEETLGASTLWVPNGDDGTVSRIDTNARREVARYHTGPTQDVPLQPSRVAVDWNLDAWVANRSFEGIGSVIRIAGTPERCVDRNMDGVIRTSMSPEDLLPFGEDECVVLYTSIGPINGIPRAMAIDGDRGLDGVSGGNVWLGLHSAEMIVELDGITGEELQRIETPGFAPYMAAVDGRGIVWMGSQRGVLTRIDPSTSPITVERIELNMPCFETYSLAIGASSDLFLSGFACNRVWRYRPTTRALEGIDVPESPRGLAIASMPGAAGTLWVTHTDGRLSKIDIDTFTLTETFDLDGNGRAPRDTIGVGVDGSGAPWTISEQDRASPATLGIATRFGSDGPSHISVGFAPHVQGDLTGWQRLTNVAAEGTASHVFLGCGDDETMWRAIHLDADLGGGAVEIFTRHAGSVEGLVSETFTRVGSTADASRPFLLELPPGGVVEVELHLLSRTRRSAPIVRRVGIEWVCGGPL